MQFSLSGSLPDCKDGWKTPYELPESWVCFLRSSKSKVIWLQLSSHDLVGKSNCPLDNCQLNLVGCVSCFITFSFLLLANDIHHEIIRQFHFQIEMSQTAQFFCLSYCRTKHCFGIHCLFLLFAVSLFFLSWKLKVSFSARAQKLFLCDSSAIYPPHLLLNLVPWGWDCVYLHLPLFVVELPFFDRFHLLEI